MPLTAPTITVGDDADGGGFSVNVAGGDAGATNAVYYARVPADVGPAAWASAGSLTGPGSVTGTLTRGYYWWRVDSTLAGETVQSGLYYQNLTESADALQQRILDAVEAGITGLAMPGLSHVYQKEVPLPAQIEFPCILVTAWNETETPMGGTNERDDFGFPVSVSYLLREAEDEGHKRRTLFWREAVRRKFVSQRLAGVAEVMTCTVEPGPIVALQDDGQRFVAKGGSQVLRFAARQTRG